MWTVSRDSRLWFFLADFFFTIGGTLVHNEFKFCSVSCTLSLVVANTLGTAKVLGSNLTRTSFLSSGNCSGSKKFLPIIF